MQYVKRAQVTESDERAAVEQVAEAIAQPDMAGVIFFCSADYDLEKLSDALASRFDVPTIGCTTAGEIGWTYQRGGIVAGSFSADVFNFCVGPISDVRGFDSSGARDLMSRVKADLRFSEKLDPERMFAFLLVDGLSMMEEKTTAALYRALEGVPLIGGSAGDSETFTETCVFVDGKFRSNAAAVALIETKLPFRVFKSQHYEPSSLEMVTTAADPAKRMVKEIDGGPAAVELARIIGIPKEDLTKGIYSTHPVMLQVGKDWYVRSIQRYHDDDSLSFACAIDTGLPLTVGQSAGLVKSLRAMVDSLEEEFSSIELTLGCDCIHRRWEIMETDLKDEVEEVLSQINFMGFSTYGEQFNGVHVNQTLTGVVVGRK